MGFSLEFFMTNGDVVAVDSIPVSRDVSANGVQFLITSLVCEEMDERGIRSKSVAVDAKGVVLDVCDEIEIISAQDLRKVYKVLNNNRDFMLQGEEGYLLNPTQTAEMLDAITAELAVGMDDAMYAEIEKGGFARSGAGEVVDVETGEAGVIR